MMQAFRTNTPTHLGGSQVVQLKDYEMGREMNMLTQTITPLNFPKSDVLQFITSDGSIISARPSGTEPKIKFYCSVKADMPNKMLFNQLDEALEIKIKAIMKDLVGV